MFIIEKKKWVPHHDVLLSSIFCGQSWSVIHSSCVYLQYWLKTCTMCRKWSKQPILFATLPQTPVPVCVSSPASPPEGSINFFQRFFFKISQSQNGCDISALTIPVKKINNCVHFYHKNINDHQQCNKKRMFKKSILYSKVKTLFRFKPYSSH